MSRQLKLINGHNCAVSTTTHLHFPHRRGMQSSKSDKLTPLSPGSVQVLPWGRTWDVVGGLVMGLTTGYRLRSNMAGWKINCYREVKYTEKIEKPNPPKNNDQKLGYPTIDMSMINPIAITVATKHLG